MHKNHFLSLLSLVFVLSSVFSQVPEQTLFDFGGTLDSATGFDLKVNTDYNFFRFYFGNSTAI